MAKIFKGRKSKKEIVEIKNFAKMPDVMELPNLIEIQKSSYEWFLQRSSNPDKRDEEAGLQSVFKSTFPIESPNKDIVLDFVNYSFGDAKYTEDQSKEKGLTYSLPLKALIRLIYLETGEVREKEIFMGDIPLMTKRGTFIINGAERVVVSQIHKSPGVVFSYDGKKRLYSSKIIPDKGAWLEFELDIKKELLYIKIDRKKNILVTNLLRAIGYETNADIIDLFYKTRELELDTHEAREMFENNPEPIRVAQDIVTEDDPDNPVYTAGMEINIGDAEKLKTLGFNKVKIIDVEQLRDEKCIIKCLEKDDSKDKADAISKLHSVTRPGEPTTLENAEREFQRLFSDPKKYDLGRVGRYKFNQKLYSKEKKTATQERILMSEDIIRTVKYLLKVYLGEEDVDDIDHLGNRRIRCVGELLVNQLKTGFSRMERAVKERMNTEDVDEITPQKLISIKPITAIIKEFFGSSQLSQFMDQTNPLAELTHKRRLNALGMGGLSRDRAGFEVRDVHHTHYGRMCPIETPEGPNIGLILSLTTFARVNEYGFLETPYRKVEDNRVSDEIEYLTAIEEENYFIAQANADVDDKGRFVDNFITSRNKGKYPIVEPEQIKYMDVSPRQIISVSTGLIPFLEHDDANRALMGSNMQRQAVPLLNCEAPLVGTGMERKAAMDSGVCCISEHEGEVVAVDNSKVELKVKGHSKNVMYDLHKYKRTNQNTCFTQKPVVHVGDKVKVGDLIADGPACKEGELALGRNLLVAFMTWDGYNYEDAILISEKVVKEDVFTSIHIEEFDVEARETKLGTEAITRDIPNLSEEALKNLDDIGVVRTGARVNPGDILVGKVTPKGETDLTPEYKLLHSIFGEKAREVKDTSLRVPHGNGGIVIGTRVFKRENGDDLAPGVEVMIKVFIAKKRKLCEGDKLAGRHGNKGVVSKILPEEDMPFMPDGTPVDIVLNPLGVPSRMNLGQILETQLGWAAREAGVRYYCPAFEGASLEEIQDELRKQDLDENGKSMLIDGRTGIPFENDVTVGEIYMLKLIHLVDDKMHARSTGPYSLVTQQPLGGKAQFGGQRLGEMEVWALEAYGAANTLQEFLTTKSDDMMGRAKIYENIVKGEYAESPGIPESFNVLVQELRGLALDMQIYDKTGTQLALTDKDDEILSKKRKMI
jgi:DNA-directed RNA polymerase subunit beta